MASPLLFTHFLVFFLLFTILPGSFATRDDLLISTTHGQVQGKMLSVLGGELRAFLGIPYGKPPLGKLRFRAPQPVENWKYVKDATSFSNTCYQVPDTTLPGFRGVEMWNPNTPLSEDCLYLNVWSPVFNKTSPAAAVLVWIFGGGFSVGTSSLDIYNGSILSKSEGVVVVSMNYRVGAFGFLSLPNNHNIRGNAGLLDQRLALTWVAKNIAAFGGDPSKVTLFGESAGSASVGFHLLSPGSQSLFQRAVMQSGSPNAPWGTMTQNEALDRAMMLGKLLGCSTSHPVQMEDCLQQADPQRISEKQYEVLTKPTVLALPFLPVVDGDFLPDQVEVLLNTTNLPKKELMLGLVKNEGTYFLVYGMPGFNMTGDSLISRNDFLEGILIAMIDDSDISRETTIFQYTDWNDVENRTKNRNLLGNLVGDQLFFCPVLEFAQRYSQHGGKTYMYLFDHQSSVNPWPEWMGVMHGYEIEFIFGMPLKSSLGYTKSEIAMSKKFMKHWANFARHGKPDIEGVAWPAFSAENQVYITLNSNYPEQKRRMKAKECQFWNKLLPQIQKMSSGQNSAVHLNLNLPLLLIIKYTMMLTGTL
uniref:Carboxylic ester hydrolase n=1 Tax=Nothobranchius furzeri TaxID=105023 RepID=A0A8C6MA17_NOTFU